MTLNNSINFQKLSCSIAIELSMLDVKVGGSTMPSCLPRQTEFILRKITLTNISKGMGRLVEVQVFTKRRFSTKMPEKKTSLPMKELSNCSSTDLWVLLSIHLNA